MKSAFLVTRSVGLLTLLSVLFIATVASATVPVTVTQQGRLLDSDGSPVTGPVQFTFSIYDAASEGNLLWEQEMIVNLPASGFYTAILGTDSNPLDASLFSSGDAAFLGIQVNEGPEFSPRVALTSVPYAAVAQWAHAAEVADTAIVADSLDPGFEIPGTQLQSGSVPLDRLPGVTRVYQVAQGCENPGGFSVEPSCYSLACEAGGYQNCSGSCVNTASPHFCWNTSLGFLVNN
jgi:hypothetical protein